MFNVGLINIRRMVRWDLINGRAPMTGYALKGFDHQGRPG